MNKTATGWSAALVLFGITAGFLPGWGPWLAPLFVVSGWFLLAFHGHRVPVTVAAAPPVQLSVAPEVRVEVQEIVPPGLIDDLQRFRGSLSLMGGLKTLVVNDTEAAVVRLTEALFTLVGNSKEVSSHIEKSLSFITNGDSGLGRTVVNLEEQVRVFEALSGHFSQVRTGLEADIGVLTQAVGSINQFSGILSDLADQTNVLAINASIEAARVGVHGRGFAVIANHVQSLAKNSKDISEKMAKTVREVVGSVETSFARQTKRIDEAETMISRSERELRQWSSHVAPQVAEVETMIAEARQLAQVVTNELGEVTVSLQFQDRTRQILDHIAEILNDNKERLVKAAGLPPGDLAPEHVEAAFREASRHFTVREEWALGPAKKVKPGVASVELF